MARELHGNKDDPGASQITETGLKETVDTHRMLHDQSFEQKFNDLLEFEMEEKRTYGASPLLLDDAIQNKELEPIKFGHRIPNFIHLLKRPKKVRSKAEILEVNQQVELHPDAQVKV